MRPNLCPNLVVHNKAVQISNNNKIRNFNNNNNSNQIHNTINNACHITCINNPNNPIIKTTTTTIIKCMVDHKTIRDHPISHSSIIILISINQEIQVFHKIIIPFLHHKLIMLLKMVKVK